MRAAFRERILTEAELRAIMGSPAPRAVGKELRQLDAHGRAFVSRSPFVLIASCDSRGAMDLSPKGDPPGFVQVLDERTLSIPDRPGNRRADTYTNVLQNPAVALLFLIPGKRETLRISGRAFIVRDSDLLERMVVAGKAPLLALIVEIEQVFFHCGKCMIRSALWEPASWPQHDALASHARCLVDHARLNEPVEAIESAIQRSYKEDLY